MSIINWLLCSAFSIQTPAKKIPANIIGNYPCDMREPPPQKIGLPFPRAMRSQKFV